MCPPSLVFFGTEQQALESCCTLAPCVKLIRAKQGSAVLQGPTSVGQRRERETILEGLFKDLEVVVWGAILHPLLCCVDRKGRDGTYVLS